MAHLQKEFNKHIALNQTLFGKSIVVGKGFKSGTVEVASTNPRGYYLWINGLHDMPNTSTINEMSEIGTINYLHLLNGMSDGSGIIKYWLAKTKWEYLLIAGVKLNESELEPEKEQEDFLKEIASFVFIDRVPYNLRYNDAEIAGDLLLAHFTQFIGLRKETDFRSGITIKPNNFISSVLDFYFKNQQEEFKSINDIIEDDIDFSNLIDDEK